MGKNFRSIVIGLSLLAVLSTPVLGQGVGAIGGTVTDDSGAVLPGATVTLSSPGVIGGDQTTVSDGRAPISSRGWCRAPTASRASCRDSAPMIQENIDVNADRTSRADLKLAVGDLAETITVAGDAPLLDTTSALNQTVMTAGSARHAADRRRHLLDRPAGAGAASWARSTSAATR